MVLVGTGLLAAWMAIAGGVAHADEEFDVSAAAGEITLIAKGRWHVNADYPWKATIDDKVFDKAKFALTEKSAKVSGLPSGTVHLKGAVCADGQCKPFVRDVAVH
jgi:hypothetical protein